ncbi:circadian clock protein LdpA [Limnothrix redekei]|uniref:LdpA C-terminal domain-containing domain n=1 Tax=Limnothrix redekei LRLZ20PSL1 TaxID=3112953 RepID=A0ABW7C894_9CYAN
MSLFPSPLVSLQSGCWFKLICGASFQHLPAIRTLALVYGLAGADCVDVAADPAVIAAARSGLEVAQSRSGRSPWLMVSLNDGEDPHFRKAQFNPTQCPSDCSRPCERVCPTGAIDPGGVTESLCYGCGRCLHICPLDLIGARSYVSTPSAIASLVLPLGVEAIEIHTVPGRYDDFARLWRSVEPHLDRLQLVAVSCPDGPNLADYLRSLYDLMAPGLRAAGCALIWQTDGRPMSGDIGAGATRAAIALGQKVLQLRLPGFVQLAGGTNDRTVPKLRDLDLLGPNRLAGVAYGSYARSLLKPVTDRLEALELAAGQAVPIETQPELLAEALTLAQPLFAPLKSPHAPIPLAALPP